MSKGIMTRALITVLFLASLCLAQGCDPASATPEGHVSAEPAPKLSEVDEVLMKLNQSTKKIRTYQAKINHLSRQPLFDSQTLRTGKLYYQRAAGQSLLRVDFNTIKQDDQPQEKYIEQFFFDGLWLTVISHPLKEVKKYQLLDPNEIDADKGVDAFDLIDEHLPIVGFSSTDKLKKEFDIKLAEPNENEPADRLRLRMDVKADSVYKDDWLWIDFWIDKNLYLPAKMATFTTEEEIYEFEFNEPKLNEPIKGTVFEPKVPKGFVLAEEVPLKRKRSGSDN